ncbi:MAG: gamma-glutamyltransferase [Bacteroidota bacterium]
MKNQLYFLLFFIICLLTYSCKTDNQPVTYPIEKSIIDDTAMVVSPHPLASAIGTSILKEGGNAVDAAIAVQLAIAVVYPRAGNIGGGGFMVIRNADGSTDALDYREKAPAAADRDMYLDSTETVIPGLSQKGHLAVGVPGTVAGMFAAHQKYGQLQDFGQLIQPAIELAQKGYHISAREAERFNQFKEAIEAQNDDPIPFVKNTPWQTGDLLQQPELAATLERIKTDGQAGFYGGKTADLIVAEMQEGNGLITKEDLANYQAVWRKPITGQYKDYRIISMPPSSSGGVALVQMLDMIESQPIDDWRFQSTETIHLMVEAMRRAYADRAEHLGDMDFYDVPIDSLLNINYLNDRMATYTPDSATVSDQIASGEFTIQVESFETTHTSIVDGQGNAVSVTTTLNSNFGSKVVVDGAGFFLNNEMDDFSAKPGVPNQFGLVGAEANAIAPGKRMLSSMTPTIIEKDGKLFMVLGSPGGSTIITSVLQVFLNVAEFGMNLEEAVNAKRFHHQWLPDAIITEEGAFPDSIHQTLLALGHDIKTRKRMAVVKAIHCLPDGRLQGVGDYRNPDDDVEGY